MPRIDQVISGLAQGAGRSLDCYWPPLVTTFAGGIEQKMTTRTSPDHVAINPPFVWAVNSQNGGTATYGQFKNATCIRLRSGTVLGAGENVWNGNGVSLRPRLGRSPIINTRDPFGASRVLFTAAFGAIPSADTDYGIELLMPATGGRQGIFADGLNPGFGFIRRANGSVSIVIRTTTAGALTFQPVEPSFLNFDATEFHTYEIRLISATSAVDAQAQFIVDGRPIATFSWGAGTVLPVYNAAYPQIQIGLKANCDANGDLWVFGVGVQASETIIGCL